MNIIKSPTGWGLSVDYDGNDPPYYARLIIHIGPWWLVFKHNPAMDGTLDR